MEKIEKLNKIVTHLFKSSIKEIDFNDFTDAETLFGDIKFKRKELDIVIKIKYNFHQN